MNDDNKRTYQEILVTDLCIDKINRTLNMELNPGNARMSAKIHQKIAEKHFDDYTTCISNLEDCLRNPTFIGEDPKHSNKIELIKRVGSGASPVMVAICIEPDHKGCYGISSAYCISEAKLQAWRQSGQVKAPKATP